MLTIELSTVVFYRGEPPREICLRDCSFPMANPPRHALAALYGTHGKLNGFVAARSYAAAQGLSYTVVDMLVDLERQNPQVMKPGDLGHFDFLNFSRMSRALGDEIAAKLGEAASPAGLEEPLAEVAGEPIRAVLARWPSLIDSLVALEPCEHLKVVAFQASTLMSARPVSIGCVPHRHWSAIRAATCRLNPNIRVSLEAPE